MYKNKKITAIIAAAGSGNRMGSGIPKQFRNLGGIPILTRTVKAFFRHPLIDEIYVVLPKGWTGYAREHCLAPFALDSAAHLVEGGGERQESVYKGILALSPEDEIVLIHDGARPFVSERIITRTVEMLFQEAVRAVTCSVRVKDTIKVCPEPFKDGVFTDTPNRDVLYAVQTPQGFHRKVLLHAHREAEKSGFCGTDDTVLVEMTGEKVYLVEGEYRNMKITTEEDMVIGEVFCRDPDPYAKAPEKEKVMLEPVRIGSGYDVHAFLPGRRLILGGVEISHHQGLFGHSDADVLTHALIDAILGAMGLGDIGTHFPDTDKQYRGISSLILLEKTGELMRSGGYRLGNADCTVIAQKPKIAPYTGEMKTALSEALQVSAGRINIKGTTTEKLGFAGREEGIAAQAVVTLYKEGEQDV